MIVNIQAANTIGTIVADNNVVAIVDDSPDFTITQHTAEDSYTITAIIGTVSIVIVSISCCPDSHPLEDTHLRCQGFNITIGSGHKTLLYSDC